MFIRRSRSTDATADAALAALAKHRSAGFERVPGSLPRSIQELRAIAAALSGDRDVPVALDRLALLIERLEVVRERLRYPEAPPMSIDDVDALAPIRTQAELERAAAEVLDTMRG